MKQVKNYLFVILFFTLDLFCFGFFEQQIIFSLLTFTVFLLFSSKSINPIIFSLTMLAIHSLAMTDKLSSTLLFLLPLGIAGLEAKKIFNDPFWIPYLTLLGAIILLQPINLFTFVKIPINLVLLVLFEKLLSQR